MATDPDRAVGGINRWLGIVCVLAIAVILRIIYLSQYANLPDWYQLTVDNYYHHHWAQSIADGNILGDTTYFRAPFYIYCLGFLYWIIGSSIWVGRLFGSVIGLTSIVMTWLIGRRIFNQRIGLVGALIQALFPVIMYFETELLLDPLFMLLAQLSIFFLLRWHDKRAIREIVLGGLFLGLAAITRPTILAFVPFVIGWIWWAETASMKKRAAAVGFVLISLGVVVLPITVRNTVVAHDPVLIASQGGINFYIGNNRYADGVAAVMPTPLGHNWRMEEVEYLAETESGRELTPGEESGFWYRKGLEEIAEDPGHFVGLLAKKAYRSISSVEISNNRSLVMFFSSIPLLKYNPLTFAALFVLGMIGAVLAWRRHPGARLLIWFMVSQIVVTTLFFFSSRFRLPLLPCYAIFFAFGLDEIWTALRTDRGRFVKLTVVAVILLLVTSLPLVPLSKGVSTQDYLSKALMVMNRHDYSAGLELLREASRYDDSFPSTNLNMGICFMRMGNTDSAFYYFSREKQLHPDRPKAYINSASLYLVNDELDSALAEILTALELRPYDVTANRIMLRASEKEPDIDSGSLLTLVEAAADRTKDNVYLLNEAALLILNRGDRDAAELLLLRVIEASPPPIETDNTAFDADHIYSESSMRKEKAKAYFQLGFLKGLSANYRESVEYSQTAIKLDSTIVEAYRNPVASHLALGQTRAADSVLSVGLNKFPDNPVLQYLKEVFPY